MDPYAKAFKISLTLHITVACALALSFLLGDLFRAKPTAVFTVLGPPAGLIAGGPSTTQSHPMPDMAPVPQGPKLPSPAPAPATPEKVHPTVAAPQDNFLEAAPPKPKAHHTSDTGVLQKHKVKTPQVSDAVPQPMSYADFQKKYAPKKPKTKPHSASDAATAKLTSNAVPSGNPSFEENLASRLDRHMQEQGQSSVGTGLGGAAGSGVMGNGTPGASDDADAVYSGTIYTYLNSVWEEPKEVGNVHMTARVEFTVDRTGAITTWHIARRSGSDTFDKSVEKVFARVKQVSAPPTAQSYHLTVNFETRDS